jgi:tRNA A37 methylthiotransferase MiaB
MNVSDTEIILSIMKKAGYQSAQEVDDADIVFLNTCAIREKAEQKIWDRLDYLKSLKTKKKRKDILYVLLTEVAYKNHILW